MKYNPSHKYIGKLCTKIIRVIQNIEFIASPDSTTITSENLGEAIEKMARELPTIC